MKRDSNSKMLKFDYIVVGSGLAGLYAAYKASMKGSVAVITKSFLRESNSFNAQGGIAAVTSDDDNPEIHKADTRATIFSIGDYLSAAVLDDTAEHTTLFGNYNGNKRTLLVTCKMFEGILDKRDKEQGSDGHSRRCAGQ